MRNSPLANDSEMLYALSWSVEWDLESLKQQNEEKLWENIDQWISKVNHWTLEKYNKQDYTHSSSLVLKLDYESEEAFKDPNELEYYFHPHRIHKVTFGIRDDTIYFCVNGKLHCFCLKTGEKNNLITWKIPKNVVGYTYGNHHFWYIHSFGNNGEVVIKSFKLKTSDFDPNKYFQDCLIETLKGLEKICEKEREKNLNFKYF